ncbi:MAG: hypothetical protein AABY09_02845, partial [Nanoarchaeota archaeon]
MMFKRGASHADWAVSMGIFIIYILSMFIIVQPGAQKVFREDNLIKIVEDGIRGSSQYTIERTPIFVTLSATPKVQPGVKLDFKLSNIDVPFEGGTSSDDYKLVDAGGNVVPLTITVSDGKADIDFSYAFADVASSPYKFDFYFLKSAYNSDDTFTDTGAPLLGNDLVEGTDYGYQFCSTEKIVGYDEGKVEAVCSSPDYIAFKESLGYPLTKEFTIYYVKAAAPGDSVPVQYDYDSRTSVCESVEPYQQASVFVKELV